MEIKPTYTTFEQAKWLKALGYNSPCTNYYFEDGEFREHSIKTTVGMDYGSDIEYELEEFYENWNDRGVTKKNGERCWGCNKANGYFETFSAPEQWQVVEWLRVNHRIWVEVKAPDMPNTGYYFSIHKPFKFGNLYNGEDIYFNSPQEAYSAAIDYVLNNLI